MSVVINSTLLFIERNYLSDTLYQYWNNLSIPTLPFQKEPSTYEQVQRHLYLIGLLISSFFLLLTLLVYILLAELRKDLPVQGFHVLGGHAVPSPGPASPLQLPSWLLPQYSFLLCSWSVGIVSPLSYTSFSKCAYSLVIY